MKLNVTKKSQKLACSIVNSLSTMLVGQCVGKCVGNAIQKEIEFNLGPPKTNPSQASPSHSGVREK